MDKRRANTPEEPRVPGGIEGKDELNLAEFPLSCIADRSEPDQKTLRFEDRIVDAARGETITRRLTITGSEEFGLPTALDDEILLGLIQLSKIHGFADRRVPFTRYQLIRLLDWGDEGKSYTRIESSLNRWLGVTLYYENAWRDRSRNTWANENFHVLDNVTLVGRERAVGQQSELPLSSFVWNDVIFRSFSAGNLKSLDFDFYKKLESAIAKRLFRFLDKRFFLHRRCKFNLKEFAWEHIGLARSYDTAGLKRKLAAGIDELEKTGFIVPVRTEERFRQLATGQWEVIFEKVRLDQPPRASETVSLVSQSMVAALEQRMVTPSTAAALVSRFSCEQIRTQLEVFDWLMGNRDSKVSRNPAGYLVSAIRGEYLPPKGFVPEAEREKRAKQAMERKQNQAERQRRQEQRETNRLAAQRQAIEDFWNSHDEEERCRLESEAIAGAGLFDRNLIHGTGSLALTARQRILDAFALEMLQAAG